MEEKKIKDMTGNREEKIASKKQVKEAPAANAPRAPKRPFVRVAYPGADGIAIRDYLRKNYTENCEVSTGDR